VAASLIALLDDIASVLDDVALMTKVAAKKTAGVLGDDLALNAQQVAGVAADRELPVVFAVAKGSALNKAMLVPAALAISAFIPWGVTPLLMLGGVYLCYEGCEKLAHRWLHGVDNDTEMELESADREIDLPALEKEKIRGAVRTDFVLSAEIITIALGTVAGASFSTQLAVLVGISIVMTIGVYGVVAGIVKLDDLGLHLARLGGETVFAQGRRRLGRGLLVTAPYLMKLLSVAGTVAVFLVGGGILTHAVPALHEFGQGLRASGPWGWALPHLIDAATGIVAGLVALLAASLVRAVWRRLRRARG
jgi:predicted DNA repair protein MutK